MQVVGSTPTLGTTRFRFSILALRTKVGTRHSVDEAEASDLPGMHRRSDRSPWWKGPRGEAWVIAQFLLLLTMAVLPPTGPALPVGLHFLAWPIGLSGLILMGVGAVALGSSLTVLPRPKPDGRFVAQGIYRVVRHPIYDGVILLALGWAVWRTSLLHLALTAILALFFQAKARREEEWLIERFPEYADYRRRVRAFIPWIY